jgi:D-alanyl-D-alanine carboxypeptidase/D-alanyl-D-alanine-endopeptidase (penicillin-binding protein 4)
MRSVNLFAEHMLNLIGYEKRKNGSTSTGLSVLENYWSSRINTDGLYINDGSGLSRSNAISAAHFTQLLKYMHSSTYAEEFKNSLPVAGVSGTLKSVCNGQAAHGKLRAKSGSMTRIKSYAGFIETTSGQTLAFALIVNNFDGSSNTLKQKMESLFNQMVNYK